MRCRRDGCREEAVGPNARTEGFKRKQYCARHYEEYKAAQRRYVERAASAPKCEVCHEPLMSVARIASGVCPSCQREADERDAEYTKSMKFDAAGTVEELKDWIREYLL